VFAFGLFGGGGGGGGGGGVADLGVFLPRFGADVLTDDSLVGIISHISRNGVTELTSG
jgi:hypothetical protein